MINKTVCITDVYDGPMPCGNPDITWIIPDSDCISSPCNGCDDNCIDITVMEECEETCVQVLISCPDCSVCDPVIKNICICEANSECSPWEKCEDGICVDKCDDYHDQYGNCVDCTEASHCVGDYICSQGECQCPPNTTDLGDGVCRECITNADCDDCEECVGIKCQPKQCFGTPCVDGNCVDCVNSGDCGPNEVCTGNNECECGPGYERNFESQQCIPVSECEEGDCPDCYECIAGNCSQRVCPEGYACYNDECVSTCNPYVPVCEDPNEECVNLGLGIHVCLPCEDGCDEVETPGSGTSPEPDNPSNPGNSCSDHGGCPSGQECSNGTCIPCLGVCPDGSGGEYDNCVENFEINKDDDSCVVEGILETSQACNCPVLTWTTEVHSRSDDKIAFRVRLRKGNAYEEGVSNIPLLGNTGIANELPTSGVIKYKVTEIGGFIGDPNSNWSRVRVDTTLDFSGKDTVISVPASIKRPGEYCLDPLSNEQVGITQVRVEFSVPTSQINTPNDCAYGIQEKKIFYTINKNGGNGYISSNQFFDSVDPILRYDTLQASGSRPPLFRWYKMNSYAETGGTLIREAYATKVSTFKYRDAWIPLEIQHYYRLESDCACSGHTSFKCGGSPSKLFYCNPDITSLNYSLDQCNKEIILSSNSFTVCSANAAYPQVYDLYLNGVLKDSLTPVGTTLPINGTYTSDTPIKTIEIKLQGLDCDDCEWVEEITTSDLDVEVDSYNCQADDLSITITGGSGDYSVEVDGTPWNIGNPIDLADGEHSIKVIDTTTDCEIEKDFVVDCCAIFEGTADDVDVCGDEVGSYDFSVSGGSADYVWEVRDEEGGNVLDSGTSSSENITADLSSYGGSSFWVHVLDDKGCKFEKTVFATYLPEVSVSFASLEYCQGSVTHEIEVVRTSGLLPISYDLKQGGVSQQTGTLIANTDHITITLTGNDSFSLELEDANGCKATKPLTLSDVQCPDVVMNASNSNVCEKKDLILTGTISGGTAPFSWEIEHSGDVIASGTGVNISVNTGTEYTASDGTVDFTFSVTDSKGKQDSVLVTITVDDEFSQECVVCDPEPNVTISSDMGWVVQDGDPVEISHNYPTAYAQEWFVDGISVGTNFTMFVDTSTPGQKNIYVEIQYTQGCFTESDVETITIQDSSCACHYTFNLISGWGSDNGNTISSNTTSGTTGCTGENISAFVSAIDCSGDQTYEWRLFKDSVVIDTKTGTTYTYALSDQGDYQLRLRGEDTEICPVGEIWFEKEFIDCRTCQITSTGIADITICDGNPATGTMYVQNKWESANIVRTIYVDGSVHSGPTNISCGTTSCSNAFSISGLAVGERQVTIRVAESDALDCFTEETFTVTVLAVNDPICRDCDDNTANITILGSYGCNFGNCDIDATEGETLNLTGSATGSPGGFTYQWKTSGGTNVGFGSSVTVGPFNYGDDPTYVLHVTDSEGCTFSRPVDVNVQMNCSGSLSMTMSESSACQGDPVTITWNITGLVNYQQYTVKVFRATNASGPYSEVYTSTWNGSYNFNMPNGTRYYRIFATRGSCERTVPYQTLTLDSCVDCTGTVNSISVAGGTTMCKTDSKNLTANVSGDTSGWTYTWRRGTSAIGVVLGTGTTLTSYTPPSLPETIRVWYTKTGCEDVQGYKQVILTEDSGCCPFTLTSISSSSPSYCIGEPTSFYAEGTGSDAGYTFTWYRGTSATGTPVGTGRTIWDDWMKETTGTEYISLRVTNPDCDDQVASLTIPFASDCCPSATPVVSVTCGSTMNIVVTNISSSDWVRFNGGSWKFGLTSHFHTVFTSGNYGSANVTVEVSRPYCHDPYIFNVNVFR